MIDDDRTPPPRTVTSAMGVPVQQLQPESTRVSMSIVAMGGMVVGVVTCAWFVALGYFEMTAKMRSLEERMLTLPTKTDLAGIKDDALRTARQRLKNAVVRCPRIVARGEVTSICELVWSPE